jgi:hypothetical protein
MQKKLRKLFALIQEVPTDLIFKIIKKIIHFVTLSL